MRWKDHSMSIIYPSGLLPTKRGESAMWIIPLETVNFTGATELSDGIATLIYYRGIYAVDYEHTTNSVQLQNYSMGKHFMDR